MVTLMNESSRNFADVFFKLPESEATKIKFALEKFERALKLDLQDDQLMQAMRIMEN